MNYSINRTLKKLVLVVSLVLTMTVVFGMVPHNASAATLPTFNQYSYGYGINGFVNRMYRVVLNRSIPEDLNGGKVYWANELVSQRRNGGQVAKVFLTSSEFNNIGYNNAQFVEILYRLFFNRSLGSAINNNYWVNQLNSGKMTRQRVIDNFINSKEWANICFTFGIASGGTCQPDRNQPATEGAIDFVANFYGIVFNSECPYDVVAYWSKEITNRRMTANDVAYSFFFGEAFQRMSVTDDRFVSILFNVFHNTSASADQRTYWVNRVHDTSRYAVFREFSNSSDWATICYYFGVNSGGTGRIDVTLEVMHIHFSKVDGDYGTYAYGGFFDNDDEPVIDVTEETDVVEPSDDDVVDSADDAIADEAVVDDVVVDDAVAPEDAVEPLDEAVEEISESDLEEAVEDVAEADVA